MKKNIKFFIVMLGVFLSTFITSVDAASFAFGKGTTTDNVLKIPVTLTIEESDGVVSLVQFGCLTNNEDVDCSFEVGNNNIIETKGTSYNTYSYNSTDVTNFPKGNTTVGNLVITNTKNYAISSNNLNVSLGNVSLTIDGNSNKITSGLPSKNYSVGAKVEEKVKSSDPTLSDAVVTHGTIYPVFNKDTYDYTVYGIADTINSVRFTLTCNEGECNPTVTGGKSVSNKTVTLEHGENKVNITVQSQDYSKTVTYHFTIIRGDTSFNSAELDNLSFGKYKLSPAFKGSEKKYSLIINNELNNLNNVIEYKAADTNAKIEVSGVDDLKYGNNTLTLTVTNASSDTVYVYTIDVYRMESEKIEISKYINDQVTFKCGETDKTVSLDELKVLNSTEYNKIVNKEYSFDKEGNIILNGDEPTNVVKEDNKEEDKKKSNTIAIIIIIGSGVFVIALSAFLIFRKKPENKIEKVKKEDNKEEVKEEQLPEEKKIEETNVGDDFTEDLTVSIEDALNDLMNTKQFAIKEEVEEEEKNEEDN